MVELLNEEIESNTDVIKHILSLIYKNTNRIRSHPKFEIDENISMVIKSNQSPKRDKEEGHPVVICTIIKCSC